ncbi:MAG: hypothetical protein IPH69_14360 [Bacteroidales bacterium]|nr:hypothetical protein [Bacteroidales bacterium]MBK7627930.1 hypothetical protein [Bacteroidales bacterium]
MKKYEGRLVGILGTVILHLIAGIIFMSFQLKSLQTDNSDEFVVEFMPEDTPEDKEKLIELPVTAIERILQGDQEMLNIARNLSNQSEQKIDPSDYIDKVKEELIKSGKLGADNYIDEQKRQKEKGDEPLAFNNDSTKSLNKDQPDESQKMASNYKGPTRIYYDLKGRTHLYLPIPIYLCQGSGKVTLAIEVNTKGDVEKAQIIAGESTTSDPCLIETAVKTALMSRFNPDASSPKIQKGTLSYEFVAQ